MIVQLNAERFETAATTLEAVLQEADFGGATVATAVNGDFVPAGLRATTPLKDGDQIEVLAPMQGG